MNREEVMELMHRELDGDLNEEERGFLYQHLSTCPDSQAMFEKLKRLSSKLEALPKVTPSISIVDQILPVLDQIDQTKETKMEEGLPSRSTAKEQRRVENTTLLERLKQKRIWIPSSLIAAALVITLVSTGAPFTSKNSELADGAGDLFDMAATEDVEVQHPAAYSSILVGDEAADEVENTSSTELALDEQRGEEEGLTEESPNGAKVNPSPRTAPKQSEKQAEKEKAVANESQPTLPQPNEDSTEVAAAQEPPGENSEMNMTSMLIEEPEIHPSPSQTYTARIGPGNEDILIDKDGSSYYITKHPWKSDWSLEHIEWVSDTELYYVLVHITSGEKQYWLLDVENRKENRLTEPYKKAQGR
ncbi:anti-sigma factor family protein [Caldalkalibacillus mannanilyticus]|uniref:anti-sigma factor family protein n=1 Tax=Caldalkalibacillus mannanilyticus TaxID=1418 RepID=UPI0004686D84|nr:zf-HC2 domain-containing protein [Caldalkalibacillus mannanilyticus]